MMINGTQVQFPVRIYLRRWVATGLVLLGFKVSAAVLYVDVHSTNAVPPFAGWATAGGEKAFRPCAGGAGTAAGRAA